MPPPLFYICIKQWLPQGCILPGLLQAKEDFWSSSVLQTLQYSGSSTAISLWFCRNTWHHRMALWRLMCALPCFVMLKDNEVSLTSTGEQEAHLLKLLECVELKGRRVVCVIATEICEGGHKHTIWVSTLTTQSWREGNLNLIHLVRFTCHVTSSLGWRLFFLSTVQGKKKKTRHSQSSNRARRFHHNL